MDSYTALIKKILCFFAVLLPLAAMSQIYSADSVRALRVASRANSSKIAALTKLSNYYANFNPDSEIYYAEILKNYAIKIKNKSAEGYATGNIGEGFFRKGNTVQALAVTFTALRIFEDIKDSVNIADIYNDLGNIYQLHDLKTSLGYYNKCQLISEKIHDYTDMYYAYGNLGIVYDQLNKPDSAVYCLKKAIGVHDARHINYSNSYYIAELSTVYDKLHQYATAGAILKAGIKLGIKNDDKRIFHLQLRYAEHFADRSEADSGLQYAEPVLSNPVIQREPEYAGRLYHVLARLYADKKQYESAYQYQVKSIVADSTLYNVNKEQQLANLTFNEKQHKIDLENAAAAYQNKLRLYIALVLLIVFIAFMGVLWSHNRKQQKANKQLSSQKQQIQLTLQELKSTQTQLIQSEKMASLGELTAGIAHEIQNPLNFVNNFSDVNTELLDEMQVEIEKGDFDEVKAIAIDLKENEKKINLHGKRADAIVKGMLQHSRASSGQKEPADLNALADEYLRLAYHGLRGKDKEFNAELVTSFDKNLPKISIVPQDIGRVLLNVINNAFYATQQKTKTAGLDYKPEVTITTFMQNGQVAVSVKDNGTGIPDTIREKIMQPFFTTKPTGQGTGLGLSLTYDMVVKGHGGTILVNSVEGDGSEFIIQLPVN